jgi:hypothetical protein
MGEPILLWRMDVSRQTLVKIPLVIGEYEVNIEGVIACPGENSPKLPLRIVVHPD